MMTQWLMQGGIPEAIKLGDAADFADRREESSSVKVRGVPLASKEVLAHLAPGHQVEKLALEWDARVVAVADKDPTLRSLKFSNAIREASDELVEDPLARADAAFLIICKIVTGFQSDSIKAFDGIAE